jgi:hypothetical protein
VAEFEIGCDEVVVLNPPIPRIVVERPDPTVVLVPLVGPPGPAGSSSAFMLSYQTPLEIPNGVRTVFTAPDEFIDTSLMVFLNGLHEYFIINIASPTFEFTTAPLTGDVIRLAYGLA